MKKVVGNVLASVNVFFLAFLAVLSSVFVVMGASPKSTESGLVEVVAFKCLCLLILALFYLTLYDSLTRKSMLEPAKAAFYERMAVRIWTIGSSFPLSIGTFAIMIVIAALGTLAFWDLGLWNFIVGSFSLLMFIALSVWAVWSYFIFRGINRQCAG